MKVLLATFRTAEDLHGAIAALGRDCVVEIYSPIEFGVEQAPAGSGRGLKYTAVIAGVAAFAGVYGLQWWSMDVAYSFIVGGRSEHPWPALLLPAIEFAALATGAGAIVGLCAAAGFPRLHQSIFASDLYCRVQDGEWLLAMKGAADALEAQLGALGAVAVREAEL